MLYNFFFFNDTATTEIYTLSLHDALPISRPTIVPPAISQRCVSPVIRLRQSILALPSPSKSPMPWICQCRSEEHTSELQSRSDLVCRLLLEKKKKKSLSQ